MQAERPISLSINRIELLHHPTFTSLINNINLGSAYLYLLYSKHFADIQERDKRLYLTICGYNWGPTAIKQNIIQRYQVSFMSTNKLYRLLRYRTPQETSDYLKRVTERSNTYSHLL